MKFKSKLFTILTAIILSLTIIPIAVQAAGGTMTDSGVNGSGSIIGGPSYHRTGWLFYVMTPEGTMQSDVKATTSFEGGIVDRNGNYLPSENIHLENRFGVKASSLLATNCAWGSPFDITGKGRGSEVKQFMLKDSKQAGYKNAQVLIESAWNQDLAIKWNQREVVLVFEPIYWNMVYEGGNPTGIWQCGTSNFFGKYQQQYGINAPDYNGDSKIRKYTNNMYANCVKFDTESSIGITPPPHGGLCTNEELANTDTGWGIGVVWNNEDLGTHTWDYPQGNTPAPAPISEGKKGIIKNYYTKDVETNEKTDDGCYIRNNTADSIEIEDEEEYKVVGWKVSNTTSTNIDSIDWNVPGTITQTGTTSSQTTLKNGETALYVLLEKIKEKDAEAQESNYTLSQSQITRRIHLSTPDTQLSMAKIQDHTFTWSIPSHKTSCSGHSYTDGCHNTGKDENGNGGHCLIV